MIGAALTDAGTRCLHLLADRPDLVDADPVTVARVAARTWRRRTAVGRSGAGMPFDRRWPDIRAAQQAARAIRAEVRALATREAKP